MKRSIDIARPQLGEEEVQLLREVIESGWLTQGSKVADFEKAFARRHEVKHAVAVTSCTTGLFLALKAIEVGPGDEVIVPAFTWVATANVVLQCGATPVFVDIDPCTYNLNPDLLPRVITSKTKAIIPVHLFGLCADMDRIKDFAANIPLIEDAACAAGARYKKRSAGSLGLCGVFSFHPRKIITTGEGGMITTNDDELAEKLNILRNHGASISEEQRHLGPKPYLLPQFSELGYNFRMTDLQGAVGLAQLKKLDRFVQERNEAAQFYTNELEGLDWLFTPIVKQGYEHSWQSYVCLVREKKTRISRNVLMERLQDQGVATRPGTHAVHMLDLYREKYNFHNDDFPGTRDCDLFSMAIPLYNTMTVDDYKYVVDALRAIVR